MSIITVSLFALGCAVLAFVGWAIVHGGAMTPSPAPPAPMPRRKRGPLTEAFCPVCGQAGVYLTRAGQPNRRYHPARDCAGRLIQTGSVTAATPEQVARWARQFDSSAVATRPPTFVQTDEPQPPQTVTTWPPGLAGAGLAPAEYAVGRATGIADVVTDTERRG